MSRVYTLYLPHPIPRAGFSLNRRQTRAIRSIAPPFLRTPLQPLCAASRHSPLPSLLLSLYLDRSLTLPSFLSLFFYICIHTRVYMRESVCAPHGVFASSRSTIRVFVFPQWTVLWQRSTALGRPENRAARAFPRMSLSLVRALSSAPLKEENLIAALSPVPPGVANKNVKRARIFFSLVVFLFHSPLSLSFLGPSTTRMPPF